jgi:2-phosphoglycolate phosphatase
MRTDGSDCNAAARGNGLTTGLVLDQTAVADCCSSLGGFVQTEATPSKPPLRAVLFDFDGTLADSYPAITASVNHVRQLNGLPPLSIAEVKPHVGRGPNDLLRQTCPAGDLERNVAAYRAHHPSVLRSGTTLLPGVYETLVSLHRHGLGLAVCSNKPIAFTKELVTILNIAEFFAAVLGPEDAGLPKPAPNILLVALARLQVRADESLYVGDMTVDIQTARAAGVTVWSVPTGSDEIGVLRAAKPDRLLTQFSDLLSVVS